MLPLMIEIRANLWRLVDAFNLLAKNHWIHSFFLINRWYVTNKHQIHSRRFNIAPLPTTIFQGLQVCKTLGCVSLTSHVSILGIYMGVSKNRGNPKSSILIGISIINHPFWGTIICGNTHIYIICYLPATIFFVKSIDTNRCIVVVRWKMSWKWPGLGVWDQTCNSTYRSL